MNQLRLIKITVFIFTFLLIFGSLVLMGSLYRKLSANPQQTSAEISLGLPSEARIKQIAADEGMLYILVSGKEQGGRIIIFSPEKGKIISNITLN